MQFGDVEIQINEWWGGRVQSDPIKYTRNQLKEKLVGLFENKQLVKTDIIYRLRELIPFFYKIEKIKCY